MTDVDSPRASRRARIQAAMTRALAPIGQRDERAPLRAWLFRIAHKESMSLLRRRRGAEPLDPEALIGPDVEAHAERRRRLAQLVSDLQQLSERQRGALLMRELGGLRHAEIAAALQTSEGAVKQAIFDARAALFDLAAGREMACVAPGRRLGRQRTPAPAAPHTKAPAAQPRSTRGNVDQPVHRSLDHLRTSSRIILIGPRESMTRCRFQHDARADGQAASPPWPRPASSPSVSRPRREPTVQRRAA
jgi:RNA polymerase sigma factor (sigma-70 family)